MRKSIQLAHFTLLLLGTLTSTAAAQTVEPETNLSPATVDAAIIGYLQTLVEGDQTRHTQVKTDLPFQEIEPRTTPTPETVEAETLPTSETVQIRPPKTSAELDLPPRSLSEADFPAQTETVNPETAPPPETVEAEAAPTSETAQPLSPNTLAEIDLPPRTLSEGDFLSQTVNPETAPAPETDEMSPLRVMPRIGAQLTTGPGVGYESSFGGIEGFVPLQQTSGQNLTFLEGRLLLSTDDTRLGGNLIVGHRIYSPKNNRTLGGYVAYDIRDTGDSVFNQVGAGVETLGEFWDARANLYIPIGDTRQQAEENIRVNSVSLFETPSFQENFLALGEQQLQIDRRFEAAMTGLDAEAGVRITRLGETGDLRGYAGLYYYDAPGTSGFLGGRVRLEARPTDTLRVGLLLQSDENFGTNLVLSVGANFPGTRPRGIGQQEQVLARLGESVTRQQNIVVDEQFESFSVTETLVATNPTTDEPWIFRHVNLGIGTGDGTFENPAGTFEEALTVAGANDIVYVQSGTNPGIPAFTIPDGVQVLSTGPVQQIATVEAGNVQLPLSGSGVLPLVTGTVTLGDDNTLSGFEINGAEGAGIQGTDINNTTIQNNIISNSTINSSEPSDLGEGISLTNTTGTIDITNNTITNNSETAILITSDEGQVELTIDSNAIADNFNALVINLLGIAQGTAQITNNSIANSGSVDIELEENAQLDNLTISNNTIDSPTSQGINFQAFDDAQATVTVSDNTLTNITGDGLYTGDGMNFVFNQNSNTQLTISGNTIDTASDDGIDLNLFDDAVATVTISNNQISNANSGGIGFSNIGIEVDADNNSQLQLLIESNTITGSGDQGISIFSGAGGGNSQISSTVQFNILTGNNVSGLTSGGFDAQTFDTSTMCLQLSNNTSDTFALINNSGTFQVQIGVNTGTVTQSGTTVAPPFVGCTVP